MKNSHKETFELVRKSLGEINKKNREDLTDQLKKRQETLARFRYFLFTQWYSSFLISLLIAVIFLFIGFIIKILESSIGIRFVFILIYTFIALTTPIWLAILTPKIEMGWDERWKNVLEEYLKKTNLENDKQQAKQNFKRAILYYSRAGQPINFIVNILWGGIFIGCLPDPDFQKALIAFRLENLKHSLDTIWKANPLGTIGLICLPFVYTFYYVQYYIPVSLLQNILAQIELEE